MYIQNLNKLNKTNIFIYNNIYYVVNKSYLTKFVNYK